MKMFSDIQHKFLILVNEEKYEECQKMRETKKFYTKIFLTTKRLARKKIYHNQG